MRTKIPTLLFACVVILAGCSPRDENARGTAVVWRLDNAGRIGGLRAEAFTDAPSAVDGALRFDGKSQGLLLPEFPIAGLRAFTIEVDVFPEAGGEFEQRFFHGGSLGGSRLMVELRSNPDSSWFLDTHLRGEGEDPARATLIDPKKTHPSGRWYAIKAVYDGEILTHYVDGVKEGEGRVAGVVLPEGAVSLGVRQNKVCWFKGMLREVRFWPEAR